MYALLWRPRHTKQLPKINFWYIFFSRSLVRSFAEPFKLLTHASRASLVSFGSTVNCCYLAARKTTSYVLTHQYAFFPLRDPTVKRISWKLDSSILLAYSYRAIGTPFTFMTGVKRIREPFNHRTFNSLRLPFFSLIK